jgi:multidrug efflux pump subunit AcrA (membrane-fusion protein)
VTYNPFSFESLRSQLAPFYFDPISMGIITASIGVAGLINSIDQGEHADDNAAAALQIARDEAELSARSSLLDYKDVLTNQQAKLATLKDTQRQTSFNISSYQNFLDRYADYFTAETTAAQAQIAGTEAAGKAQYDQLMEALGYADAQAGATGRVAAGSSQAAVTGKVKENVTDFVGQDMTLDANGGLYGLQITAQNMAYDQLVMDLGGMRTEYAGQIDIWQESLDRLAGREEELLGYISDTEDSISDLEQTIADLYGED